MSGILWFFVVHQLMNWKTLLFDLLQKMAVFNLKGYK